MSHTQNRRALKEAVADTALAMVINFPLNLCIIYLCRVLDLTVLQTSVTFTTIFTIVAIVRKYFMRLYFSKK